MAREYFGYPFYQNSLLIFPQSCRETVISSCPTEWQGGNTEDNIPGEGKLLYDIRFTAFHNGMVIKFLINVEAQKSTDPRKLGYHLENRILFYLARMISAQKHTEFFHSDYDSMERVRSIWSCWDAAADGDSIEEIGLMRKTIFGGEETPQEIGLAKGIVIHLRRGRNLEESRNQLIAMLETLFSETNIKEKKRILAEEYGMVMTTELEGRMNVMCNWSENILEDGIEQGLDLQLARKIQIKIGKGKSVEQIADELEETVEHIHALMDRLDSILSQYKCREKSFT